MTYEHFRQNSGFEIVGWPEHLTIQALENYKIADLKLIKKAIEDGGCKYRAMTTDSLAEARTNPAPEPRKRKQRSDKGKTHKKHRP